MKIIVQIARWFVGLLFVFSGLVKTIDPLGFSYKLEEYFSASVFDIPILHDLALPLSVFFVIFEVVLGVLLILGIFRRYTLLSLIFLIVFFTFLTFYSAYFNKVTDCGCFGDAIPLKPWESFGKDVILSVLILIICIGRKYIRPIFTKPISYGLTIITLAICILLAYQGINHLPIKDFRPYAIGKNITEGMKSAEELGLEEPKIDVMFELKNKLNNNIINLTENEYINDKKYWEKGSPWELVSTTDKVVKEGYTPPIHDFIIDCEDGGDLTSFYLEKPSLILITTPKATEVKSKTKVKVQDFIDLALKEGIEILGISAEPIRYNGIKTCLMDGTTLKTVIRSNPGIVVLKKGTVVAKYHHNNIPDIAELKLKLH